MMHWTWILASMISCLAGQSAPGTAGAVGTAIDNPPSGVDGFVPPADRLVLSQSIRVELRAPRNSVPVGAPVIVEFSVINITAEPVELVVPGALVGKERPDLGMGLPLEHLFSGPDFRGLEIVSEENPRLGDRITRKPEYPIPPITIAPFAVVGLRFDASRFYPGLHQKGVYELRWRPYGGAVESPPLVISVVQYKQVVLETEYGSINMELLYDQAPQTVENFLELVESRFYNNKLFHLVHSNQFLLGGCPKGNGTGKRSDGKTIAPEFNRTPFDVGTVAMALVPGDPNSASCQFFICLSRNPGWDGKYTAFAQVRGPQSLAILRKLGEVAVDDRHRPVKPLLIRGMSATETPFTAERTAP